MGAETMGSSTTDAIIGWFAGHTVVASANVVAVTSIRKIYGILKMIDLLGFIDRRQDEI
jgi:hypothetical protein